MSTDSTADVYRQFAAEMFKVKVEEVTDEQRKVAKRAFLLHQFKAPYGENSEHHQIDNL